MVKRIPGNRIFSQEHFVSAFRGRTPALVLTITKAEVDDTGVYQCRSGNFTKNISLCVVGMYDLFQEISSLDLTVRSNYKLLNSGPPRLVSNSESYLFSTYTTLYIYRYLF